MPTVLIDGKDVELIEGQGWKVIMHDWQHASDVRIEVLTEKTINFMCPFGDGLGDYSIEPFDRGYVIGRHVEFIELIKDVDAALT